MILCNIYPTLQPSNIPLQPADLFVLALRNYTLWFRLCSRIIGSTSSVSLVVITDIHHDDFTTWLPISHYSPFWREIHRLLMVSWYNRPVMQTFDDFVVVDRNKLLNQQSYVCWNETPWPSCEVTLLGNLMKYIYFDIYLCSCKYLGAPLCCCFGVSVGNSSRQEQILITFSQTLPVWVVFSIVFFATFGIATHCKLWYIYHWNPVVVMLPTLSSLAPPYVGTT